MLVIWCLIEPIGTFVGDGDSLTAGAGLPSSGGPYPSFVTLTGSPWAVFNTAVNGQTLVTSIANAPATVDPHFTQGVLHNIVAIWSCIDDIAQGATPATCYANLKTYVAARHAVGWKVIVVTLPSSKNIEALREQFNTLLVADHSFADGFVNFNSTAIGCDGCWSDTTVFQADGIHPNQNAVNTIEVPAFNTAINAL